MEDIGVLIDVNHTRGSDTGSPQGFAENSVAACVLQNLIQEEIEYLASRMSLDATLWYDRSKRYIHLHLILKFVLSTCQEPMV